MHNHPMRTKKKTSKTSTANAKNKDRLKLCRFQGHIPFDHRDFSKISITNRSLKTLAEADFEDHESCDDDE